MCMTKISMVYTHNVQDITYGTMIKIHIHLPYKYSYLCLICLGYTKYICNKGSNAFKTVDLIERWSSLMVFHAHLSVPLPLASLLALLLCTKEDQKKQVEEEKRKKRGGSFLVLAWNQAGPLKIGIILKFKLFWAGRWLEEF